MIYYDNTIIKIILPIIQQGLVNYGFNNVAVVQANQPTIEGINTTPTVYFYKTGTELADFPGWLDTYNGASLTHSETQYYFITFKVFSLVLQYPVTPDQYTASDLTNAVASILQSASTVTTLNLNGMNVLKIRSSDNPYFVDDKKQYEAIPSFDFVLSYKNVRISEIPKVTPPIQLDVLVV